MAGALRSTIVADSLFKAGFAIRAQIIWAKERLVMSVGDDCCAVFDA